MGSATEKPYRFLAPVRRGRETLQRMLPVMATSKTSAVIELLVTLDRSAAGSMRHKFQRQLREGVGTGQLEAGTTTPSTRALAARRIGNTLARS
jgi:hypothetical protein